MATPKNTPVIFVNTRPHSAADETAPIPASAAISAPESLAAFPFAPFAPSSSPDTFLAAITGQSPRRAPAHAPAAAATAASCSSAAASVPAAPTVKDSAALAAPDFVPDFARDALSAAALAHGLTIIDAPLLTYRRLDTQWPDCPDIRAIALTSRHAVQALSEGGLIQGARAKIPVYCVGDATAIAAFEAGFETVFFAEGTARDLADLLRDDLEGGTILFPSGTTITPSTMPAFEAAGLTVHRWPVYDMDAAACFPPALLAALAQGAAMVVPFFSGRSAQIWSDLMMAQGLKAATAQSWGLCIAAGVVKFVDCLDWKDIIVPARPDMSAMVKALDGVMRTA